jgi:hypothetical protein
MTLPVHRRTCHLLERPFTRRAGASRSPPSSTTSSSGCEPLPEGRRYRAGAIGFSSLAYRELLPADVKAEEIKETLADGVLNATVPKAQAAKPRHIEITPA